MVECKGIRNVTFHAIHWYEKYAKANSKCVRDYDEIKESSELKSYLLR